MIFKMSGDDGIYCRKLVIRIMCDDPSLEAEAVSLMAAYIRKNGFKPSTNPNLIEPLRYFATKMEERFGYGRIMHVVYSDPSRNELPAYYPKTYPNPTEYLVKEDGHITHFNKMIIKVGREKNEHCLRTTVTTQSLSFNHSADITIVEYADGELDVDVDWFDDGVNTEVYLAEFEQKENEKMIQFREELVLYRRLLLKYDKEMRAIKSFTAEGSAQLERALKSDLETIDKHIQLGKVLTNDDGSGETSHVFKYPVPISLLDNFKYRSIASYFTAPN